MVVIVRIYKEKGDSRNFLDIGKTTTLSRIFRSEFGIGHTFTLGDHKYTIEEIGVSGFYENADIWGTIDGEYERNTTLYFYCQTDDPRADDFQANHGTLKQDISYYQ